MVWDFDYSSISSIAKLLEENGLSMTKKFGQNFLISLPVLDKFVDLCDIQEGSRVWEVGPGIGALTTKMLQKGAKVTAFEIDHGFCRILREQAYPNNENFRLIEGDALKNWKTIFEEEGLPDRICANLPYNVGSIFIASLIEQRCIPKRMVYTLQTEVVQRMCANRGSSEYSSFSILTNLDYENKEAFKIKSGCFFPPPNVDSSVVLMNKREKPLVSEEDIKALIVLVRTIFSQRRKTVKNNLKGLGLSSEQLDQVLLSAQIPQTERAEKLEMQQLIGLLDALKRNNVQIK